MATWDTTLVNRLRFYINDIVSPYTFSDTQLAQYIAISSTIVDTEVDLGVSFTIDTDTPDITPDPTSSSYDAGIGTLFVLKAGCMIVLSEIRRDSSKLGIRIKDDLTDYDAKNAGKDRQALYKTYTDAYDSMKKQWQVNNRSVVRAVFGSYSSADSANYGYYHNTRGLFNCEPSLWR